VEHRVLVLAPYGRDARVIGDVLAARQINAHICTDRHDLIREIGKDSAATILTEESLGDELVSELRQMLENQPPWSDYPFVVLAARLTVRRTGRAQSVLQSLSNLVLLERPVNADTLASAAQSALRARRRQYLTRKHLADLEDSKRSVERVNDELETRISERTADLAGANDRLMREILERERVENSLVQNQKMEALGRLTGGIAHDFNNLLHVVNLNLQLLERLKVEEDRVRVYARRAKEAVERGSRLTAQLLSFARTQSLVPKLHDVNALIRNMAELISISVGSHVKLSLTLCPEPAFVIVDAAQMEMAILNLSVNARDAMPQGGMLEIHTQTARAEPHGAAQDAAYPLGCVDVAVRDTGTGIAENLLDKIFDPFFTTKQHAGTGLGLSQVYGFTRQSGGNAIVESTVGTGTSIKLRFPLAPQPQHAAKAAADAEPLPGATVQAEILVVEDDPGVRRSMVECLQVLGFRVRQAADGASGLAELQRARPDLLLVDYLMPQMNGAELIVHAQAMYRDLPILMATGYADMNVVEKLIGPQSVLAKPFDLDTLGTAVSAELRRTGLPR
jgi:signal transduction histidine kinase/CheY-like chemotaxis protein